MEDHSAPAGRGLSALVYTQLTDVEDEVNGLFTYDRAAPQAGGRCRPLLQCGAGGGVCKGDCKIRAQKQRPALEKLLRAGRCCAFYGTYLLTILVMGSLFMAEVSRWFSREAP